MEDVTNFWLHRPHMEVAYFKWTTKLLHILDYLQELVSSRTMKLMIKQVGIQFSPDDFSLW